jgi:translocation and assembly module TamB
MGRHFRVSGSGLEGSLKGAIRLQSSYPGTPQARGAVEVADGAFQVQGRKLRIRRGRLLFEGPLDNPLLDIVAVREHLRVESGFAVAGTAMAPVAKLISDPEVGDADKLSWLVLGTDLRDVDGMSQMLALQAAAATLFGEDGARYALGFAGKPSMDLLSVREHDARPGSSGVEPSDASRGAAALVGSRLSSRLVATCEQSLRSVWNILKLQYEITDRLSLSAQAGSDTAAALLGLYPFD